MKIIIINGPNLNMLKMRNENHYGAKSLEDIEIYLKKIFPDHYFEFYQSNVEGEIVTKIQEANSYFDGIVINPAAYSHTSVAIHDALELIKIPKIEVHLSNLSEREDYRKEMITASACDGYISGFKEHSYSAAVFLLEKIYSNS